MIARRCGAILNVSSAAAVMPIPGLLVYGVSKAGLERLTTGAAEELRVHGVTVNCLRIDVPLASEGFVYNAPELDKSDWQPTEVGAAAALWMLGQPPAFTGQVKSLSELRGEPGATVGRAAR
jgi:citronellol/citronellal dehydrogenase